MKRIAYITGLLLTVLSSCNKTTGKQDNLIAQLPEAYFKNTQLPIDSLLLQYKSPVLKTIYKERGYITLWDNKSDRQTLRMAIEDVVYDGLEPGDYALEEINNFEAQEKPTEEQCIQHDLLLTETFYKLANHLFKGKVDPDDVYDDWDLQPKELDVNKLLNEALNNHSVARALERCRPPHPIYTSLRNSLKLLRNMPEDSLEQYIPFEKTLKLNDQDSAVIPMVRRKLSYWKDLAATDAGGTVLDNSTYNAIRRFQERHGLVATGKIDSATVAELNVSKREREDQIIVNLERWRWFPYDLGENAVLVNIPAFMLAVVENNKDTIQMHKVVVGKPERRTPVIVSKFNGVVINPTWTVPPTIIREDLTPAATDDRNYFTRLNMTIYDSKGREVSPAAWNPDKANNYRYVQGPGLENSLGEIKFNFNNRRRVYLHDTNHRELFDQHYRAFSSGCVRVDDPFSLAVYMLTTPKRGLTEEKIMELLGRGETATIGIKKSIHVNQLYWTAWMDKYGLQFRHDIYGLDNILLEKLSKKPTGLAVAP